MFKNWEKLRKYTRLKNFQDRYFMAQSMVLILTFYGFYWAATEGPWEKVLLKVNYVGIGAYGVLLILVPKIILKTFPPPFNGNVLLSEPTKDRLLHNRAKLAALTMIAATMAHNFLFIPTGDPLQKKYGLSIIVLSIFYSGWVMRSYQKPIWIAIWLIIIGKKKGRGMEEVKDLWKKIRVVPNQKPPR